MKIHTVLRKIAKDIFDVTLWTVVTALPVSTGACMFMSSKLWWFLLCVSAAIAEFYVISKIIMKYV